MYFSMYLYIFRSMYIYIYINLSICIQLPTCLSSNLWIFLRPFRCYKDVVGIFQKVQSNMVANDMLNGGNMEEWIFGFSKANLILYCLNFLYCSTSTISPTDRIDGLHLGSFASHSEHLSNTPASEFLVHKNGNLGIMKWYMSMT